MEAEILSGKEPARRVPGPARPCGATDTLMRSPGAGGEDEEDNREAHFDEALCVRRRMRMKTSDPRRMEDGGGEPVAERIRLLGQIIMEEEQSWKMRKARQR